MTSQDIISAIEKCMLTYEKDLEGAVTQQNEQMFNDLKSDALGGLLGMLTISLQLAFCSKITESERQDIAICISKARNRIIDIYYEQQSRRVMNG